MKVLFILIIGLSLCEGKEELVYGIFTSYCWDKLFVKVSFDFNCIKLALSKALGYSLVIGASIIKIPQIVNIISAKSTKGLAEIMLYTEAFVYMISTSYSTYYGQPFSTFGENAFLWIQAMIILCLLWYYNKMPLLKVLIIFSAYAACAILLFYGELLGDQVWMILYTVSSQLSKCSLYN